MKCYGCGIEKDMTQLETYPYPEEDRLVDEPIEPLFVMECQAKEHLPDGSWGFRAVVVCHECFHKLDPDMWIGEDTCWEPLKPVIPFNQLPPVVEGDGKWKPEFYPIL
jgi:hypothetical protein